MLSSRRTAKAAARFLGKALKNRADCPPETINTDQNEAYGTAIKRLKERQDRSGTSAPADQIPEQPLGRRSALCEPALLSAGLTGTNELAILQMYSINATESFHMTRFFKEKESALKLATHSIAYLSDRSELNSFPKPPKKLVG